MKKPLFNWSVWFLVWVVALPPARELLFAPVWGFLPPRFAEIMLVLEFLLVVVVIQSAAMQINRAVLNARSGR